MINKSAAAIIDAHYRHLAKEHSDEKWTSLVDWNTHAYGIEAKELLENMYRQNNEGYSVRDLTNKNKQYISRWLATNRGVRIYYSARKWYFDAYHAKLLKLPPPPTSAKEYTWSKSAYKIYDPLREPKYAPKQEMRGNKLGSKRKTSLSEIFPSPLPPISSHNEHTPVAQASASFSPQSHGYYNHDFKDTYHFDLDRYAQEQDQPFSTPTRSSSQDHEFNQITRAYEFLY